MGKFQNNVEQIIKQVDNIADTLLEHDDSTWTQTADIAKWFLRIAHDLKNAVLDEELYSERTHAGFPTRPGTDQIDETLIVCEFQSERIHLVRFTHPGLTGRDGSPANLSLAKQPRNYAQGDANGTHEASGILHERVSTGAGDGQRDDHDGDDGTDGD